ncbi:MAG: hypothetical protein SWZ49_32110 [Cyanobacteriota bacterium]|nr:hypothetical protein [Cyanobacteriota bacterium]
MKEYKDIYEILDDLRKRPSIYLGSKKSLTALVAFFSGLRFAQMDEGNPPFCEFSRWISRKIGGSPFQWTYAISRGIAFPGGLEDSAIYKII